MRQLTCEKTFKIIKDFDAPLHAKISIFSAYTPSFPNLILTFTYLWSQLQLLILFATTIVISLINQNPSSILKVINHIFNYFFLGNIFDFTTYPDLTIAVLTLCFIYLILTTLILLYTVLIFTRNFLVFPLLQRIWRNILDLHGPVVFFPLHINTVRLIFQLSQGPETHQSRIAIAKILSTIILVYNFILSFSLILLFHIPLKTKHPFSTKKSTLKLSDLLFKFLLPFVWYKDTPSNGLNAVAIVFICLYCFFRDWILFHFMPYYRLSSQFLAIISHAVITSLMIASLFGKAFSNVHHWHESEITGLFWILMAPCLIKVYVIFNGNLQTKTFMEPLSIKNLYYLLQYPKIHKSYSTNPSPSFPHGDISRKNFEYFTILKQAGQADLSGAELEPREIQNLRDEYFLKKIIEILNQYLTRNPNEWLCKCALARLYTKSEGTYALTSHLIESSAKYGWRSQTAALFTKFKVITKLNIRQDQIEGQADENKKTGITGINLDIQNFLKLQRSYDIIRRYLAHQLGLQMQFWRYFQNNQQNYVNLLQISQQIKKEGEKFKPILEDCKEFIQKGFGEPLLIYGLYCCLFQYNLALGQKLVKEYFQLERRNKQAPDYNFTGGFNSTSTDKRFSSDAIYLIISSSSHNAGEILNCSGKVELAFGISRGRLIGKSINTLMPSFYAKNHDYFLKNQFQASSQSILNKTREITAITNDGYIMPCLLHISFTYLSDYGFCYYALLEPIKDGTRLLLINEEGKVLNISEDLVNDLDISSSKFGNLNIVDLCPEYGQISPPSMISQQHYQLMKRKTNWNNNDREMSPYLLKSQVFKERNLTFFAFSHHRGLSARTLSSPALTSVRSNQNHIPVIYQAQIRKIEINFSVAMELKMKKVVNFGDRSKSPLNKHHTPNSIKFLDFALDAPVDNYPGSSKINPMRKTSTPRNAFLQLSLRENQQQLHNNDFFNPKLYCQKTSTFVTSPAHSEHQHLFTTNHNFETYRDQSPSPTFKIASPSKRRLLSMKGDTEGVTEFVEEEDEETQKHMNMPHINIQKMAEESSEQETVDDKFLNEMMMQSSLEDDTGGGTYFESNKVVHRQEILRKILNSSSHFLNTKIYIAAYLLTSLILLTFLIWLNFYTSGTSEKVGDYSKALQDSHFRSYWNKIAVQDTGYWLAAEIAWTDYPADVLAQGFNISFHRFLDANKALGESIQYLSPELQALYSKKNVRILQRDSEKNLNVVAMDNTFQASYRIINQGFVNIYEMNYSKNDTETLDKATLFIFDNSLDDLQVQSEYLTEQVKTSLFDIFDTAKSVMIKYLIVTFVVLFSFVVFSLRFIVRTNLATHNFVDTLYTLQIPDIKKMENLSFKFKEVLDKDFQPTVLLKNLHEIKRSTKPQTTRVDTNHHKQKGFRIHEVTDFQQSLKKISLRNYLLFIGLFLCLALSVAFTWIYFSQASNQLTTMRIQNTNINSALEYVNIVAWTAVELQLSLLKNGTTTTRNKPIIDTFLADIENLKNVNRLQNSLKNEDGDFSPEMQVVLFKFPCTKSYTPYYSYPLDVLEPECVMLSDGLNYVGLLNFISLLGMKFTTFMPAFSTSQRTIPDLAALYNQSFEDIVYPLDINFVLLLNAYSAATDEFSVLVEHLKVQSVKLAWIAVIVTICLGIMTWVFIMRKVLKIDFESRDILGIIPSRLLLGNAQLKRYVVRVIGFNTYEAQKLLR